MRNNRQNSNHNLATRTDLKKLENKLDEEFVTKKYLNDILNEKFRRWEMHIDHRLERFEERIMEKVDEKLDRITITLDKLLGAFQKFDREHDILTHQQASLTKRVEKLEEKASKIN